MLLGYNTNGLAHHEPLAAIELLAAIGYRSVALTIDHHLLNPFSHGWQRQLGDVARLLEKHQMRSVIETGARYLLDPQIKHEPTLISATADGRQRRVAFLMHAVDVARALGSDCVSLWSGVVHDDAGPDVLWSRLTGGLAEIIDYGQAGSHPMPIGFEPEPGMMIATMRDYGELRARLADAPLRLTLDVGHLHCEGERLLEDAIVPWGCDLVNVHIEDMRRGVHEHLMFGDGEMDFPPLLAEISRAGYQGGVHVELSRHSHLGPQAAAQAYAFLRPLAHWQAAH